MTFSATLEMPLDMETPRTTSTANPSPFTPALTQALEQIEAEMWSRLYRAATADDVTACALNLTTIDSATVMAAGRLDILAFNRVVGLGLGMPASDEALDRIVHHYAGLGVPRFFVQVSPAAAPATLFDALGQRGFRHYNNWVKLYRGVEAPPDVATDLRVERIGSEHASTFAALVAPAFDWPAVVQPWLARLVEQPGWRHYAAFDGDVPVATAAMFTTGTSGYLGPAATHPDHRRRGAQSALIARRLHDAQRLGCQRLITETAEDRPDRPAPSYRNMRRFGFQVAYLRPNYIYESDPHPSDA